MPFPLSLSWVRFDKRFSQPVKCPEELEELCVDREVWAICIFTLFNVLLHLVVTWLFQLKLMVRNTLLLNVLTLCFCFIVL